MKRTVLIDFDGVIHSYASGWQGKQNIPDDPNPGAIEFLRTLIAEEDIEPVIWTSRVYWKDDSELAAAEEAIQAIHNWLYLNGLSPEEVDALPITSAKPPAVLLIDDRAFKFEGVFPSSNFIREFKPWPKDQPIPQESAFGERFTTRSPEEPDLRARVQYLIDNWPIELPDGGITFPDGDFWPETKS